MLKYALRFILLISIFSAQPFWLAAQNNYEVRKIAFEGNKSLEKDFLLERMAVREVSWLEKIILKKEPYLYSTELIKLDLERLKRTYQSEGFLEVVVELQPLEINEKKKTVKLSIKIEEGKPVVVDSIGFELTAKADNVKMDSLTKKVLRQIKLEPEIGSETMA